MDITLVEGCTDTIIADGFIPSSTFWQSIYPGNPGDYNSFLSCTFGCEESIIEPDGPYPDYIDFQVCGLAASLCDTVGVCDVVRVFFADSLDGEIVPQDPMVCYGNTTTPITVQATGGEPPFVA